MSDAAMAMRGDVVRGDTSVEWSGIALDSRRISGGELFFALSGEQVDGHRFVGSALAAGAAGAVVESVPDDVSQGDVSEGCVIRVPGTYDALHDLTRWGRERAPEHLVGITGSAGKTTTKDLLTAMLSQRFRVAPSPGNYNNLYGFPLALLGIPNDTEWMVAEMGMSTPGELGGVSRLGRPDVAVFTCILPVHLEQLGSLERIVEAKAELLQGLSSDGLVVANADDPKVLAIASRHAGDVVHYGFSEGAEVRADGLRAVGSGTAFRLVSSVGDSGGQGAVEIALPLLGEYNVSNFLAAAAAALSIGVTLEEIAASAKEISPSKMRGEVHRLANGLVIIDDSYNSNPEAAVKALAATRAISGERHWAVLGSMLELGPESPEFHARVGQAAAEDFPLVVGVGEEARALTAAASEGGAETRWFPDRETALDAVLGEARAGDVILIKGSRGVGLETLVQALVQAPVEKPVEKPVEEPVEEGDG